MILTFELEPELEVGLQKAANQEHSSPAEMAKKFIRYCLSQNQTKQTWSKVPKSVSVANELIHEADDIDGDLDENQKELIERIKNIKRVTSPYSSEEMVRALREGKEYLLIDSLAHHGKK